MKYFLALCVIILSLLSCSFHSKKIHIGFNTWAGYQAVAIANEMKFFAKEGVDVEVQQFNSLDEVKDAFAQGKIDVMFSTINEVLTLAEKGSKLKVVLVADYSNGADTIAAQQSIHSLQELKGKKIGVELGSVSNFVLLKALQKVGLTERDVTIVNITPENALAKFSDRSLDAITTWSPYTDKAIQNGGHLIFSSREIPGEIIDVMAIREDLITKRSVDCLKIVSAYFKTINWLGQNKEEGIKLLANSSKMSVGDFEKALHGIHITPLKDNIIAFGNPEFKGTLYSVMQQFMLFLLAQKVLTNPLNTDELIYPNFVWEFAGKS